MQCASSYLFSWWREDERIFRKHTICLSVTLAEVHTLVSNYHAVTEAQCSAMPIFHKICALRKVKHLLSYFHSHLSLLSPSQSTEMSVALTRIQVCTVSAVYCTMFWSVIVPPNNTVTPYNTLAPNNTVAWPRTLELSPTLVWEPQIS